MKSSISVTVRPVPSLDEIIQSIEQMIRVRAYERYVEGGRHAGREVEDWQAASIELLRQPTAALSEAEFQSTLEFLVSEEEARDSEVLASEHAIVLIGRRLASSGSASTPLIYRLVSLSRSIDTQSLRAEYNSGKLHCGANVASMPILKATA